MNDAGKPKPSNLTVRVLTAVVAVPVILWMLFMGPPWVWAAFVLVPALGIAGQELFAMTLQGEPLLQTWGITASLLMGGAFYTASLPGAAFALDGRLLPLFPFALLVVVVTSLLVSLSRPLPSEAAGARMAWLAAGPLYLGATVSALASLHALDHGGAWVVLSMMLAWFADTAGYFAGRFLGGKIFGARKMSPHISPNKTWEGALGGVCGSMLAVLFAHFVYLPSLSLSCGLLLALVAGPLGICGDLVESLIKRSTGTKDSGWIVPGHGGLIDRIDALMFTAPTTLLFARFFVQ